MGVYLIYNMGGDYQLRVRLDQGDVEAASQLIPKDAVLVRRYDLFGVKSTLRFRLNQLFSDLREGRISEQDLPETLEEM